MTRRIMIALMFVCFIQIIPLRAQAVAFTPITADNAAQLRLLDTIPDYRRDDFRTIDVRFFSQNGRVVATSRKVRNLVTGQTLDLAGQGYPLALNPDGSLVLVAEQDIGTLLVDVSTGDERMLMAQNADAASFSPDGELVAVSSRDADAVQVWDVASLSLVKRLGSPRVANHPEFTADGQFLIYMVNETEVMRWTVDASDDGFTLNENASSFEIEDDGRTVLVHGFNFAEYWDEAGEEAFLHIDGQDQRSNIRQIAISPDRKHAAVAYYGRLDLLDLTVNPVRVIAEIETDFYPQPLFTPDSQILLLTSARVNGARAEAVQFYDASTGSAQGSFQPSGQNYFSDSALTPDGKALITASFLSGISVWRLNGSDSDKIAQLAGQTFVFSPDGSTVLTELDDEIIGVYGVPSAGRSARTFVLSGSVVPNTISLRVAPSSDAAIIGYASGEVRVLGRSGEYAYLPDQQGWVRANPLYLRLVADLPIDALPEVDPTQVATLLASSIVLAPEPTASPEATLAAAAPLPMLKLPIGTPVLWIPEVADGLIRITPDNAAQVALLGVLPQGAIEVTTYPLLAPAISPDGRTLFVPPYGDNRFARAWDLRTFTQTNSLEVLPIDLSYTYGIAVAASPDGKLAYTADDFRQPLQLRSLNPQEGALQKTLDTVSMMGRSLLFSPDGQTLYYPGALVDTATMTVRAQLDVNGDAYFSADSRLLALVTAERAYIIDISTGEQIAFTPRQTDYGDQPQNPVFSPDDRWLAAVTGRTITVFDTSSGHPAFSVPNPAHEYPYESEIAVSPDSHYLLVLSVEEDIQIYDLDQRQAFGNYFVSGIKHFAFSPDGRLLAIGNPLRLIDLTTGTEISIAGNYEGAGIAFTPDGTSLLLDTEENWGNRLHTVMVFGIPNRQRSGWQPLTAQVVPSGITARAEPDLSASRVGVVSGAISVSARNQRGTAVFVPSVNGWIWSAPAYLDLGRFTLDMLPVRATG